MNTPLAEVSRENAAAAVHSAPYVWYVVLLLSTVAMVNYMDRTALSVLMPLIKADLQLSDGQLGLLVGFAFFLCYAICGIPIARFADRGIRRDIIAVTLVVWSVMTALSGAAQNFWHLLAARVGLGAGEAGCIPAAESMISDYVPLKRRPGMYAIYGFGMTSGSMVGLILAGWLGETIGWRWTFVVLGVPGIALGILVRLTLREPVRGAVDGLRDERLAVSSLSATIATLWRCRTYRLLVAFYVVSGFFVTGSLQWLPSFYARVFGFNLSSIGIYLGLAIGAGSAIGTITGGVLANKAAQRDVRFPLVIGAAAYALALPAFLGALFIPSLSGSMLLAFLSNIMLAVPGGPVSASMYSVTKPRMRATACAFSIFCMSILGFGLGPFVVGVLSDILGPSLGNEALRYALLLPLGVSIVPPFLLYAVAKAMPHDLRAAGIR